MKTLMYKTRDLKDFWIPDGYHGYSETNFYENQIRYDNDYLIYIVRFPTYTHYYQEIRKLDRVSRAGGDITIMYGRGRHGDDG